MKVFSLLLVATSTLHAATANDVSGSIKATAEGNVDIMAKDVIFKVDTGDVSAKQMAETAEALESAVSSLTDVVGTKANAADVSDVFNSLADLERTMDGKLADADAAVNSKLNSQDALITSTAAKIVSDAAKLHCQDGKKWNAATSKCTGSPVLLSESNLQCGASTNGLAKLDEKGAMVVCNGEKKKFQAVGSGGAGGYGLSEDMPGKDCETINARSPYQLKSGKFFFESGIQKVCVVSGETITDVGGDGSSKAKEAQDCWALKDYWGNEKGVGNFYIRGEGKVECNFDIGAPADKENWSGRINFYAPVAKDASRGDKQVAVLNRNGELSRFKMGSHVLIHQTQHNDAGSVGNYEWNIVKEDPSGGMVSFVNGIQHDYCSGKFDSTGSEACVTQLVLAPYVKDGYVTGKVTPRAWDGYYGGIVAMKATKYIEIRSEVNANGMGFRGGLNHPGGGHCQAHGSAGFQGESYMGKGKRDGNSAGFGCCSGPSNAATGYRGRGKAHGGGGGGGAGACHGGGGAGGGYGTFDGVGKCSNACGHKGKAGDGSPECYRAGSWSERGNSYGDAEMSRPSLGSGGGGGNSYSPHSSQKNNGGRGGGLVFIDAGTGTIAFKNGKINNKGLQGLPVSGSSKCNWWRRANPQDGSGGAGSGGGVVLAAKEMVNLNGNNRVNVDGGICGCDNGWRSRAQMGGAGGKGRIAAITNKVAGSTGASAFKQVKP